MWKLKGGHSRKNTWATHLQKLVSIRGINKIRFLHKSKVSKLANFYFDSFHVKH